MKKGFTLVEIMVAVSIFAIVAVVATGALVTASEVNRKVQAMKLGLDNLNFAMDSMIFHLTRGGAYDCLSPTPSTLPTTPSVPAKPPHFCVPRSSGYAVAFYYPADQSAAPITYRWNSTAKSIEKGQGGSFSRITSSNVVINDLKFYVSNPGGGSMVLITIAIAGQAGVGKYLTDFNFQTTVASRASSGNEI